MYLILVKYFYYFYFLKKNKKFKFFILIDLIYFLMRKYYCLLTLKKKLVRYKNFFYKSKSLHFKKFKNLFFQLEQLLERKIEKYNIFIIELLPTQLLPLGNRKKFYNLINKKLKKFFLLIKKKLNKKFFFFFMVQLFNKIKFLFFKSDPFLNKKDFIFNFFTLISFESKYSTLLQIYNALNKKIKNNKNIILQFYDIMFFFSYRIDYLIFKLYPFYSLPDIRNKIIKNNVFASNYIINNSNLFISKYQLLESVLFNNIYSIFSLRRYFSSLHSYNNSLDLKKNYYLILSYFRNIDNLVYIKKNKNRIFYSMPNFLEVITQIYNFFNRLKNKIYTFDSLNDYISNFKIKNDFPFFSNVEKKDLIITVLNNIGNINYSISRLKIKHRYHTVNLINFINLFFYLHRYKILYYYTKNNKLIISPMIINNLLSEYKKSFFYLIMFFNFNISTLL